MMKMLFGLLKYTPKMTDTEIWKWAQIEYKKDADWAFYEMKKTGLAPSLRGL